ncbi:HYR-like domain-containing protein, partial [Hyunsoonleella rubra]
DNGSNDACGIQSLALDTTAFTCAEVGTNTVTLTVTDNNNNTSTCTATVTVEDNVPPVAICQDITVQLDASGNASITTADIDNGSNDACGIQSLALDITDFTCANVGANNVTLTVTDNNGNTSSCTATVTVEDNVPPVAICQDITVQLDDSGNAFFTTTDIDNGSNDACGIASISLDTTVLTCANVGANTVTLTVTDNNGNSSTCTATVTVEDNINPTIDNTNTANIEIECGVGNTQDQLNAWLNNNAGATATDNCNTIIWTNDYGSDDAVRCDNGAITVIFTATDANGNTSTTSATYLIKDTVGPNITTQAADQTVECDGSGNLTDLNTWLNNNGGAIASDDCSSITWSNDFTSVSDLCGATGAVTVTFTATDACNNSNSTTATFTIEDTTNPTWSDEPQDMTVECDGTPDPSGAFATWLASFSGSDACGSATVTHNSAGLSDLCGATGAETVTFTLTDECGNFITKDATFTIEDTTNPTWTVAPSDLTVECDGTPDPSGAFANWLASFSGSDTCGTATVTHNSNGLSDLCGATGTETVTFTLTDECGNFITADATFTIEDTINPTWDNTPADLTVECDGTPDPSGAFANWLASFSGSDTCGTATVTTNSSGLSDLCGATGTETVTFTLTDECGNFITADATFTIEDTTNPVIDNTNTANIEIECGVGNTQDQLNAWLNNNAGATATDSCSSVTWTNDYGADDAVKCDNGALTVTFTAIDECGNSSTTSATYLIKDTVGPNISTPASDSTVECDGAGNMADLNNWLTTNGGAMASDDCSDVTWSNDFTSVSDLCGATGAVTVTFTATDNCNNSSTTTATFTIEDTTAPSWTDEPQDMTVECDSTADHVATFNTWLASFSGMDSCGSATVTHNSSGLSDLCGATGSETVTFTLTDECGNSITKNATFTIEDTTNPTWTVAPSDLTVECDGTADPSGAFAAWLTSFSGEDTCGTATVTHNSSGLQNICGTTASETVTFTLTDECGNSIEMEATFGIVDTTAPTWTNVPVDMTVECDGTADASGAFATWLTSFSGTDTCGSATVTNDSSGLSDLCGATGTETVTFTLTDECGNAITRDATFTIEDTTAPSFEGRLPEDVTAECDAIPDPENVTATDNCGTASVTVEDVNTAGACEGSYTIARTYTATDECGLSVSYTQTITVVDTTAPVPSTAFEANLTVSCTDIPDAPSVDFTDNCSTDITVVFNEVNGFDDTVFEDYQIVRTWTVRDDCGNEAAYTQTLDVMLDEVITQVTGPDRCHDDGIIELDDFLTSDNKEGTWEMIEGDTDAELNGSLFNPTTLQPSLDFRPGTESIQYVFRYTGLDSGCINITEFSMKITPDCIVLPCEDNDVVVSKALTPNGDGINDSFDITGIELCGFTAELKIFNRWGALIYESSDYRIGEEDSANATGRDSWGGIAHKASVGASGTVPNGTYYYIITLKDSGLPPYTGPLYIGTK